MTKGRAKSLWDIAKNQEWYVVVNDMLGGWAVANADLPLSQLDFNEKQFGIADFLDKDAARHIVELHNAQLGDQGAGL